MRKAGGRPIDPWMIQEDSESEVSSTELSPVRSKGSKQATAEQRGRSRHQAVVQVLDCARFGLRFPAV